MATNAPPLGAVVGEVIQVQHATSALEESGDLQGDQVGELSDHQLFEIEDVFSFFDSNADGKITSHELGTAMRLMGLNPSEKEVEEIIRKVDQDGDGTLDFEEFKQMMAKKLVNPDQEKDELMKAFQLFDKNNDGKIGVKELAEVMGSFGETLCNKEIEQMISEADFNSDGMIDYEEFCFLMLDL